MRFPNKAGDHADTDDILRAELKAAGIPTLQEDAGQPPAYLADMLRRNSGEVKTSVIGCLHGWEFKRAWYYWMCSGPGIEVEAAERLHAAHGKTVRVAGHCGCPSPRERFKGLACGSYHVDSPEGLKALADTIKALVAATPVALTGSRPGSRDSSQQGEQMTEQKAFEEWRLSRYTEDGECDFTSELAEAWHAALQWARTQQEPAGATQHLHELNDEWLSKLPVGTKLYTAPVAPTVPQWQPIDTAPKDGSSVLIYMPEASRMKVREACWATPWEGAPNDQCYWITPHGPAGRGFTILPVAVTHWTPLPAAPKEGE